LTIGAWSKANFPDFLPIPGIFDQKDGYEWTNTMFMDAFYKTPSMIASTIYHQKPTREGAAYAS